MGYRAKEKSASRASGARFGGSIFVFALNRLGSLFTGYVIEKRSTAPGLSLAQKGVLYRTTVKLIFSRAVCTMRQNVNDLCFLVLVPDVLGFLSTSRS